MIAPVRQIAAMGQVTEQPARQTSRKKEIREFWAAAAAGEFWAVGETDAARLAAEETARYSFEPFLQDFARFADGRNRAVLEIGVGMGCDHLQWARSGCRLLAGIDLTDRSIRLTRRRLDMQERCSALEIADCESLPFRDNSFDIVYSWGVVHHSPDTPRAIGEIRRVLRPGGVARVMIYHTRSLTGYMLWLRYGLLAGQPRRSLAEIYDRYLESPGTKAFTVDEARTLFADFAAANIRVQLNYGDLLQSEAGRRHRGPMLTIAKMLWPRWLLRRLCRNHGLYLLIEARK